MVSISTVARMVPRGRRRQSWWGLGEGGDEVEGRRAEVKKLGGPSTKRHQAHTRKHDASLTNEKPPITPGNTPPTNPTHTHLGEVEGVVPQPRLQVGLHLGEIEVGALARGQRRAGGIGV